MAVVPLLLDAKTLKETAFCAYMLGSACNGAVGELAELCRGVLVAAVLGPGSLVLPRLVVPCLMLPCCGGSGAGL